MQFSLRILQAFGLLAAIWLLVIGAHTGIQAYQQYQAHKPKPGCGTSTVRVQPAPYTPTPGGPNGQQLFNQHCSPCHPMYSMGISNLAGVQKRWPSQQLLILWIQNWPQAVASGDAYVIKTAAATPAAQPLFTQLTTADCEAILDYLQTFEPR
ncbi:MAG TPA: cytochrome c [Phnomibacter sp.]|nr:cytochrome c [Phnomibacter sp.]